MCLSVSVRRAILLLPAVLSPLAVAQVQLEYGPPVSLSYTYSHVVPLPNGNRFFVGTYRTSTAFGLDGSAVERAHMILGTPVYNFLQPAPGGSGNDIPQAVAVDRTGNIWIAGETDSDDFTLVNPIVGQKVPYRTAGFVIELDPTGQKLLFATYLAGHQRGANPYSSLATAIALDAAGNAYVGGSTNEADFPTTPGAFLSGQGGWDSAYDSYYYTFLAKIAPTGKLVYSTQLRTGSSACTPFVASRCIGHTSTYAGVSDLAVDSSGAVTVAGIAGGTYIPGYGYVSSVAPDGSKLIWDTGIPGNWAVVSVSMAQDSGGNVNLFGRYVTLVSAPPGMPYQYSAGTPGLYAAKLSSNGSTWLYTTDLGPAPDAGAAGIALDPSGNAYLAGTSSSPQFPALAGVPALGADFVLRLDSSGTKPQKLFRFPKGVVTAPPAFEADGRLMLPGAYGSLLHLPPGYAFDTPAIVAFGNSASYEVNTGLYPGALVSLFGFGLPVSAQDVQVLIDGLPAPVLYSGSNQINFQVPFLTTVNPGIAAQFQVVLPSGSLTLQPPVAQSLGIFTNDGTHAAALNQDGTINSASNPAPGGSIVTIFGTGAIWPYGIMQDGAVATGPKELNGFSAFYSFAPPLAIHYAGAAPGLIDGVFQINLQAPPAPNIPFTVQAESIFGVTLSSNPVQVYVK
jgi:uncharacterized protein (TIGR03437 family)